MKFTASVSIATLIIVSSAYDMRSMDIHQRSVICADQIATCNVFCSHRTDSNTCDSKTMAWSCVCTGGRIPRDSEITLPVPYFQCTGSYQECVTYCTKRAPFGGEQDCIDGCGVKFKVCDMVNARLYLIFMFYSAVTWIPRL